MFLCDSTDFLGETVAKIKLQRNVATLTMFRNLLDLGAYYNQLFVR